MCQCQWAAPDRNHGQIALAARSYDSWVRQAEHLRNRLAMMILYMPKLKVSTQPAAIAIEDMPPPGRLRPTLTAGKPPCGGPSCTMPVGVFGPPPTRRMRVHRMSASKLLVRLCLLEMPIYSHADSYSHGTAQKEFHWFHLLYGLIIIIRIHT